MSSAQKEAAAFVRDIMEAHLQAFWDEVDRTWKPRLKAGLAPAAERALAYLRQELGEQGGPAGHPLDMAARKLAWGQAILRMAQEQAQAAQLSLESMVSVQVAALESALTINGLAGDPRKQASRRRAQGGSLPRLAAGAALDEAVRKSALAFTRQAWAALEQAAAAWRSRLETIACTVARSQA